MASEKQIHDFLVSGQSEGKTINFKNRGLAGTRNQIIYQLGRGMSPQDIVTPADQAAAQTRSLVQHTSGQFSPQTKRANKRKLSTSRNSHRSKSSSRSHSSKSKKRRKTQKNKITKRKKKKNTINTKRKKTRNRSKKGGRQTSSKTRKRKATPRAKLQIKKSRSSNKSDVFTRAFQ